MLSISLTVLVGFLALGVDLGQGYLERRTNQNAADAASIAGEKAMLVGASDSAIQSSILHVLNAAGWNSSAVVFLSSTNPQPGTDSTKAYVDAEYGSYPDGSSSCTPLSSNQYVGSVGGSPPSGATCIHVKVTTSRRTLFSKVPIIGAAQIAASATGSAGQVSLQAADGPGSGGSSATPTPAPWDLGSGEGFTIWGGQRADGHILVVGDPVVFFADSGWNSGSDVQTNCNPCEYNATQNFKGMADPQCFQLPLTSSCTGPNGAHGNPAAGIQPGTYVQVVVVDTISHQGSENIMSRIGLATIQVLSACPSSPSYLQTSTNGVCGTIMHVDAGQLNEGSNSPTPTSTPPPTPVIGNTN